MGITGRIKLGTCGTKTEPGPREMSAETTQTGGEQARPDLGPLLDVSPLRLTVSVEVLGSCVAPVASCKVKSSGNIWPASSPGLAGTG